MAYYKTSIALKEIETGYALAGKKLSGIVRVEHDCGISELHLSLINFSATLDGQYYLFFIDSSSRTYLFELGKHPFSLFKILEPNPNLDKGFCAGVCLIKDYLPLTVLFACTEDYLLTFSEYKKIVADKCYELKREQDKLLALKDACPLPKNSPPPEQVEIENASDILKEQPTYDDEAVATENYYSINDELEQKINLIKETEHAFIRDENAMPNAYCQEKTQKSGQSENCVYDEANADNSQEYSEQNPYYKTVKDELENVFSSFPSDESLLSFFPDSRWARVNYNHDKYYVVGVIKENNKEKYICYGVPAKYSTEPPETLKDCATFIPLSIFDLTGNGFWMMFQDAVNGSLVKGR